MFLATRPESMMQQKYLLLNIFDLDENFQETEWLSVSRKYNQYYRVDGQDSKKKINIPKNNFPDLIIDQISEFKS